MGRPWNILVTARTFDDSGIDAQQSLKATGCRITFSDRWGPLTESSLIEQLHDIDAVIAATDPYSPFVFEQCPNLKLVARCGVVIDSVSLTSATDTGIVVTNVPDAMTDAVADYCFALLLSGARHICEGLDCMQRGG